MNKIQVINLERSVDRKNEFITNNQGIDYEFVNGVDGKSLSANVINDEQYFINPLSFPSSGAYGVALSHLRQWERAIDLNSPITVSEDDAIFREDFSVESSKIIKQLPEDWDIILWGWNFDSILSIAAISNISPSVMIFNQDQLRKNIDKFRCDKSQSYPFRLDKCFGIPAYTISPKGARIYKSECFPMKNFDLFFPVLNKRLPNTGIDLSMNKIYSATNAYVAFPPLAVTKNDHEISTIQNRDVIE
jgi:GR25 family glycosyltransferase involved in LPS biosynthesis